MNPKTHSPEYMQINIEEELEKQKRVMNEQDEDLERLGKSMGTIKEIAININGELEDQEQLLIKLDTEVDESASKLKTATNKITTLTKKVGDPWCIGICIVVLIVMFIVVLVVALQK